MEIRTCVCLDPHATVKEGRRLVDQYRDGERVMCVLIIDRKPFKTYRRYIAGGGVVKVIAGEKMVCLDCGCVREFSESRIGSIGEAVVLFCKVCKLQLVPSMNVFPNTIERLVRYDPIVYHAGEDEISYINIG